MRKSTLGLSESFYDDWVEEHTIMNKGKKEVSGEKIWTF